MGARAFGDPQPRFGQGEPARRALDEADAGAVLQRRERARDRRRRALQPARRARQAAGVGDGAKNHELVQAVHGLFRTLQF